MEERKWLSRWLPACILLVAACSGASDEAAPGGSGPSKDPTTDTDTDTDDGGVAARAPSGPCTLDAEAPLTFEERRLTSRLPGKDVTFASELLEGTGFDGFARDFANELCDGGLSGAGSHEDAKTLVIGAGTRLWRAAVDRAQGRRVMGTLPASDDRMLYFARLAMTRTLRGWMPFFAPTDEERVDLAWELERASRGQHELVLPTGDVIRVLLSGFDPFSLGIPGGDQVNIRTGNPSGAAILALDGVDLTLQNGKAVHIETYVLPVTYAPFERGMQEDTVGPFFREGPSRVDVAMTMSQGSGYAFELEEWNGRYHGELEGNDDVATCKGGVLPLPRTPGCNILPPERWSGYSGLPWSREQPPQFTRSSLPVGAIMNARTGGSVPRPPGSLASLGNAFDVLWSPDFLAFPSCETASLSAFNEPTDTYPPPVAPTPPPATACAKRGGGGDYLSNESAYRATLLRDLLGVPAFVGHLHLPVMTRFEPGHESQVTDSKFEAYRTAIIAQTRLIVEVVAGER